MKRVLIVIPSYSGKVWHRVEEMVYWWTTSDKFLCNVEVITRRLIHTARNMAIEMAINGSYDYLLMCDDDNAPVDHNALQLLLDANVDIISWIIRKRKYPHKLAVFDIKRNTEEGFYDLNEWETLPKEADNHLHPVGNVWTGFILYSTKFLKEIYKKYDKVPFESKISHWLFHYRAKFMGYKIYVHDQVLLDHWDSESGQVFSV